MHITYVEYLMRHQAVRCTDRCTFYFLTLQKRVGNQGDVLHKYLTGQNVTGHIVTDKMSQDRMSRRQNVTGQDATRTKCHWTKYHKDKMSSDKMPHRRNVPQTKCHRTKCHTDRLSQDKMSQDKMPHGQNVAGHNATQTNISQNHRFVDVLKFHLAHSFSHTHTTCVSLGE